MEIRHSWLDQVIEEALEPERAIVDPHHHFFEGTVFPDYHLEDLRGDIASGHRVEQTVFMECGMWYRKTGPEALAPVGETEAVAKIAAESAQGATGRVAAILGHADLRRGAAVREVLEAHVGTSELFRGIRHAAAWDADKTLMSSAKVSNLYADPAFREGFAQLAPLGLTFDAYQYHPQTPQLTELARAFPDTSIICDHLATPVGVGVYAGQRAEVLTQWRRDVSELATCPNVVMKLGGLCMPWNGFGFDERERPPSSDELVETQRDYFLHAIDAFGPDRCMFESNFPVDKLCVSYGVLWNGFKKIAVGFSEAEKDSLFRGTATRVYSISK
jgi:predicted TIM-barrel fold metal-dependent hydrolase